MPGTQQILNEYLLKLLHRSGQPARQDQNEGLGIIKMPEPSGGSKEVFVKGISMGHSWKKLPPAHLLQG